MSLKWDRGTIEEHNDQRIPAQTRDDSITGQPFDHWTSFDVYIELD